MRKPEGARVGFPLASPRGNGVRIARTQPRMRRKHFSRGKLKCDCSGQCAGDRDTGGGGSQGQVVTGQGAECNMSPCDKPPWGSHRGAGGWGRTTQSRAWNSDVHSQQSEERVVGRDTQGGRRRPQTLSGPKEGGGGLD